MKSGRHHPASTQLALSAPRKRLFTVITLFIPVAALAMLELTLRITDYGPDLSLFTTIDVAGKSYHVMNPSVKSRYFTMESFHPATSQDLFLVPKPAGTYRIFCLGGSTMVGYPYWFNAAPSTFLRDRLRRTFPSRTIEVINVAMTATNSFTVADLTRDVLQYEPDLLIVYDGHNEFYGALGVASHESVGGSPAVTHLYLSLLRLRTFLLVRDGIRWIARQFGGSSGDELNLTMMEQLARGRSIPYGSDLYLRGLSAFRANLDRTRALCTEAKVPFILSTQVSNLRSLPPFVSDESSATAVGVERGKGLYDAGQFHDALTTLRNAGDTLRADSHYWMARCLDTLGENRLASHEYTRARDLDQLRFRTSSDFNAAIRSEAGAPSAFVADIEALFASSSSDSITGSELLFEHLHPRARGYFLIGREYARVMRQQGLLATPQEWSAADSLDEETLWEDRPITELDSVLAERRTQILTTRWPFVPEGTPAPAHGEAGVPDEIVGKMLTGSLTWEYGHVAAAERFEAQGNLTRAALEYRALINQYPQVVSAYLRLGRVYQAMRMPDDAERIYLRSLDVERTGRALRMLGTLANNRKRFTEAIRWFQEAIPFGTNPAEQSEDTYNLVLVMLNAGMRENAIQELRRSVERNPSYLPAQRLLQQLSKQPG